MDKRDSLPLTSAPLSSPVKDARSTSPLRAAYFQSEHESRGASSESPLPLKLHLESKLNFQYRGDIFGQHGAYSEANLYMSRLPSSRKGSILRPKASNAYLKLAPMELHANSSVAEPQRLQQAREKPSNGSTKAAKVSRKRQYALAVEAMASSPALRSSLLSDNVISSLLPLVRTKDAATLASCVATLCFLSSDSLGREGLLMNNAFAVLTAMATTLQTCQFADAGCRQALIHNFLAMLANLTIENTFESVLVKEKALESLLKHRKTTPQSEWMCIFSILNLSCQTFSYPRVEEVIHAIHELSRDVSLTIDHRETLSRALYNLSCTRLNQTKLIDGDAVTVLRTFMALRDNTLKEFNEAGAAPVEATRLNALMTMCHLAENPQCHRSLTRPECVRSLVDTLHACSMADTRLRCTLMILTNLATDESARQRLSGGDILDALAALVMRLGNQVGEIRPVTDEMREIVASVYRLMALLVSSPTVIDQVSQSFLAFLLAFHHDGNPFSESCSRYVLFSLASILWWNESDEGDRRHPTRPPTSETTMNPIPALHTRAHIDDLLDDPAHLDPLFVHVEATAFRGEDSAEILLQMLLLYNMAFRYNKVEIARRASARLKAFVHASTSEPILGTVCGTLFCLCQEYETHRELHMTGVLDLLPELLARCCHDVTTQMLCLDVVCIVFDGRMLGRSDLVTLMTRVAPSLVTLCEGNSTSLRTSCAACFARFACIEECRPAFSQHGVIRALAILANEEDTQTLRLCVSAYSHLSRDPAICAQLINSGIIKSLTFLAAAPEEAVRRACAMTLCNLSTSEENIGALAKAGALKALLVISCVKSNDPETRRICMKAVMNLLRLPANIPLLCQDGLVWAFGLFASGMEPKDYDILCDGFCALAFYPATRKGIAKSAILTAMFQIFDAPTASLTAKIKLLKGISNVLCDLPHAAQLIHAGILPHLMTLVGAEGMGFVSSNADGEARMLIAQVLVLIFQSCPDAESEFAEDDMLRTIDALVRTEHGDCGRCCSILLYQMSLHAPTRCKLVGGIDARGISLLAALPELFLRATRDTQALLVRLLYNVSCDSQLNRLLNVADGVACLTAMLPKKIASLAIDTAAFCAGLLRNLSCEPTSHQALMEAASTALLQRLYDVDDDMCKEDLAVCICNLLMGRINSSALLARGVLPMVLWLCSTRASLDSQALGTTVVRKLARAPGNAQVLVDGGVISHLALLMQDCKSLFVKTNCIAIFCCVSRRPGVPPLLASYGVIGNVLAILNAQQGSDTLFETMCVDLLSALAEFARADDAVESKLASILYNLIENDEGISTRADGTTATWQTDRTFLARDAHSPLIPPTLSSAHQRVVTKPSTLRHTLYPIRFSGHAVDFPPMASTIEVRTIEPALPSLAIIGEAVTAETTPTPRTSGAVTSSPPSPSASRRPAAALAMRAAPPSRFAFAPLPMFTKLCTPFAAMPSRPADQQHPKV